MESRSDLKSILPHLPLHLRSSSLFWPPQVVEALKSLTLGPDHSNVDSGEILFLAISDLRNSLNLSPHTISSSTSQGYTLFFDELMSRVEAKKWFQETVPKLATLLLRFPSLLEDHYENAGSETGLRLLESLEAGIVFLSQELIGAILACSLFCLFPTSKRGGKRLPQINFDYLFASLYPNYSQKQENKIKCLVHYFQRICICMSMGVVSFERKVLPVNDDIHCVSYPKSDFWSKSMVSLCCFEVCHSGMIEDHLTEAVEVDFANKYIGGGALSRGCLQEEIRFMINPELIAGMLFLPSMADNEAIEIVGTERFSNYSGYASTFRFLGDYLDKKPTDCLGRRKTRIVAIDALCSPDMRQYRIECLLREINKAFCGFSDLSKHQCYQNLCQDGTSKDNLNSASGVNQDAEMAEPMQESPSTVDERNEESTGAEQTGNFHKEYNSKNLGADDIGIVTGNWGGGAFGGDIELKSVIQWLAASQASRPFIMYCTFREEALQNLEQASGWILSHGWTVGDLWNMLVEYSSQRTTGETHTGFLSWLLPALTTERIQPEDLYRMKTYIQ